MKDKKRYEINAHRMQTGVTFTMETDPGETSPKHLRVGVNAAMSDQSGLVALLIEKKIFSEEEYTKAVADAMEKEADRYAEKLGCTLI